MIGIAILGVALLMLSLQIVELSALNWWPWTTRQTHGRPVQRRQIPADWNRIMKETELTETKKSARSRNSGRTPLKKEAE